VGKRKEEEKNKKNTKKMNMKEENEPKFESVYLTEEFIYHYWSG
jgi:hypothetical protein